MDNKMEEISWKIIDKYFTDNPSNLVRHHLDSYNDFIEKGIFKIFKENNPIRIIEREEENQEKKSRNECLIYLGGKQGDKIYFGKPIIYDDLDNEKYAHYMYPNDARLRNMTYGSTIHYDVEIDFIYYTESGEKKETYVTFEKVYLGKIPIMLQSNLCILHSLSTQARFNMGECKNDYGGYFIIDGKEKSIICQEKFADNMLYVRENKMAQGELYSHSAEIRSVSEDPSKPLRTVAVKIVAPSPTLTNNQIVVLLPNVRKPIPLFIVMRALGVISDKKIIEYCLLDLEKNESYIDLFIPSVHNALKVFNQKTALQYISTFIKRSQGSGVSDDIIGVQNILMNYFLPHIGENNFLDKAYFLGYMVRRLLRVYTKEEKPTDRDNFRYKRVELSGSLLYDLFREYFNLQNKAIALKIDRNYYLNKNLFQDEKFLNLINDYFYEYFKDRTVDTGIKKAMKGNWGSQENTKKIGVVQDLNRLSWNSFISQLRKLNLPLDASAKVVGPRLLHSSQWGFIDPVDTPDGGNIGLHKHLSITTYITTGYSAYPMIEWMRNKINMRFLQECDPKYIYANTKVMVNGNWVGVIENPLETVETFKLFRRNGILPVYTSIYFDYENNEILIYTDSGRLSRPIYYFSQNRPSFSRKEVIEKMDSESDKISWNQIISGWKMKKEKEDINKNKISDIDELYPELKNKEMTDVKKTLEENAAIVEYIDASEEESAMIANGMDDLKKNKYYTHIEIHPSLILGVLGNSIIFPENNPYPRNAFSCGQSKQAVSVFHTNFQNRIDKMGVVLNFGQIPLVKSRYLNYINREQQPYGFNAIVAIMSYTGYNVEDAILINEGSLTRGIFRTTYYTGYQAREESVKVSGANTNSYFSDVISKNVSRLKPGFDYSHLDKYGLIKENTELDDKTVLIGKVTSDASDPDLVVDSSVFPKKGQLGFVDKSFVTEGEEGFRVAKVRVREDRIPAIGDKFASRAGQKGTIGLVIPEEDMPFTEDGLRPDLIINPHALPSRMTIGQLIESLLGTVCTIYGGFGDCTAFVNKGSNVDVYGELLTKNGFHSSGTRILCNGMTGEQLESNIYIGPTYYMRLKHMVKDKINYRATGARNILTRQTNQGRANDGGLRIGEMERDGIMAHGAAKFLNESFLERGDEYYMAVCNKTGAIAIYNQSLNLFLSPFSDGPIQFTTSLEGKQCIENISRFGRSFSIVRVPYALKLLIQELQTMNVQMRIITEDNIEQLINMSYSTNINKLLNEDENSKLSSMVEKYIMDVNKKLFNLDNTKKFQLPKEEPITPPTPRFEIETPPTQPTQPTPRFEIETPPTQPTQPTPPFEIETPPTQPTPPFEIGTPIYLNETPPLPNTPPLLSEEYEYPNASPAYIPSEEEIALFKSSNSGSPQFRIEGGGVGRGVGAGEYSNPIQQELNSLSEEERRLLDELLKEKRNAMQLEQKEEKMEQEKQSDPMQLFKVDELPDDIKEEEKKENSENSEKKQIKIIL
jgi:DNA-directed RNA polymerase II subunit RPB2